MDASYVLRPDDRLEFLLTHGQKGAGPRKRESEGRLAQNVPLSDLLAAPEAPKYKTIKAAKAAGFVEKRPEYYGGEVLKIKGHVLIKNPESAQSQTTWKKLGRKVKETAIAHACRRGLHCDYYVYRLDQTDELTVDKRRSELARKAAATRAARKRVEEQKRCEAIEERKRLELVIDPAWSDRPARVISEDILRATWTLNRHAKRLRHRAQQEYKLGHFTDASWLSREKEAIYAAKNQVLAHCLREGRIKIIEYHRFGRISPQYWVRMDTHFINLVRRRRNRKMQSISVFKLTQNQLTLRKWIWKSPDIVSVNFLRGKEKVPTYQWPAKSRERRQAWGDDCDLDVD